MQMSSHVCVLIYSTQTLTSQVLPVIAVPPHPRLLLSCSIIDSRQREAAAEQQ